VTSPQPVAGVRTIFGDRTRDLETLSGETFDAVIDTSGYVPHVVERSARFFAGRTGRYVFVSTVSVYDISRPELHEDSPMLALPDGASRTEMTDETYGPLKALCERVVASTFRQRATIVRPGLIVGPHDPTDRFTYWPVRFARGGDVLAPAPPDAPVQFVDVRDLADFVVHLVERNAPGDYNVTSPQGLYTMGGVLSACAAAARLRTTVTWADEAFLLAHDVAPWMDLPLWIPPSIDASGILNINVRKALIAGLRIRRLADTIRDTLTWFTTLPRDHVARAGLTPDRETSLLSALERT